MIPAVNARPGNLRVPDGRRRIRGDPHALSPGRSFGCVQDVTRYELRSGSGARAAGRGGYPTASRLISGLPRTPVAEAVMADERPWVSTSQPAYVQSRRLNQAAQPGHRARVYRHAGAPGGGRHGADRPRVHFSPTSQRPSPVGRWRRSSEWVLAAEQTCADQDAKG